MADPTEASRTPKGLHGGLRLATLLGFTGGFLMAYQRSSKRFWGWTENVRLQTHSHLVYELIKQVLSKGNGREARL